MGQTNSQTPQPACYEDDEISLLDLAMVIWKNRWLAAAVALLITAAGTAYALMQEHQYEYVTLLEIGNVVESSTTVVIVNESQRGYRLIEEPTNVQGRLKNVYIPAALQNYRDRLATAEGPGPRLKIDVSIPRNTDLIMLRSEAPIEMAEHYLQAHQEVVKLLQEDYQRVSMLQQRREERELDRAKIEVDRLQEQRNELKAELEKIETQEKLLQDRLKELQEAITDARERRAKALAEIHDASGGIVMMMVENELQRYLEQVNHIEERLQIELPKNRLRLENHLKQNQRQLEIQNKLIEDHQLRLDNFSNIQMVLPPQQSAEPVNVSKIIIIALSVVLGGMLGLFSAFINEFGRRFRMALHESSKS